MDELLIRRSMGRVTIWISEDVANWHDAELFDVVRELNALIFYMETGKTIQLYPVTTRSWKEKK